MNLNLKNAINRFDRICSGEILLENDLLNPGFIRDLRIVIDFVKKEWKINK